MVAALLPTIVAASPVAVTLSTGTAHIGPRVSAVAVDPWSARLSWKVPSSATTLQILREGRLIDQFPATGSRRYTDHLLWPATRYTYEVRAFDARGRQVADVTTSVTTARQVSSLPRSYSRTSFWNTPIPMGAPREPNANSRSLIAASILPWQTNAVIDSDAAWGIPVSYADPHSKVYDVGCTMFGCDTPVSFPIPRYAAASTGSDGHLAVFDAATNRELDMWKASYDPATDTWSAGARTVTVADWGAVCAPGEHCGGGGVAAGFNEWGGVIRPEEIAQGHIDHALVISMPYVRADAINCPATNIWASQTSQYANDPSALPLGAHIRLSRRVNVDSKPWPRWEKVIAHALQTYGAYVADVDATVTLRGEPNLDRGYDAWAIVGMTSTPHPSLADIPWERFRVLALQPC